MAGGVANYPGHQSRHAQTTGRSWLWIFCSASSAPDCTQGTSDQAAQLGNMLIDSAPANGEVPPGGARPADPRGALPSSIVAITGAGAGAAIAASHRVTDGYQHCSSHPGFTQRRAYPARTLFNSTALVNDTGQRPPHAGRGTKRRRLRGRNHWQKASRRSIWMALSWGCSFAVVLGLVICFEQTL